MYPAKQNKGLALLCPLGTKPCLTCVSYKRKSEKTIMALEYYCISVASCQINLWTVYSYLGYYFAFGLEFSATFQSLCNFISLLWIKGWDPGGTWHRCKPLVSTLCQRYKRILNILYVILAISLKDKICEGIELPPQTDFEDFLTQENRQPPVDYHSCLHVCQKYYDCKGFYLWWHTWALTHKISLSFYK